MGKQEWPWLAFLLLFVGTVNFITMPNEIYTGDPLVARQESISMVEDQALPVNLNRVREGKVAPTGLVLNPRDGKYYSKFGLTNSLFFAVPIAWQKILHSDLHGNELISVFWINIWQILMALVFVFYLWRIGGLFGGRGLPLAIFVLAGVYSTFVWNYLRAQNTEILGLVLFHIFLFEALVFLRNTKKKTSLYVAWLALSLLVFTRLSYLFLVPAFLCFLMWEKREKQFYLVLASLCAVLALLLAWNNFFKFGSIFKTGYEGALSENLKFDDPPLWSYYQAIFSPRWGILIQFPLLILAIFHVKDFFKKFPRDSLFILALSLPTFLILCKSPGWRGEFCYGPRYFLFFLPALSLPSLWSFQGLAREGRQVTRSPFYLVQIGVLLFLLQSVFWQIAVIRRPFYTDYMVMEFFSGRSPSLFQQHLESRPLGAFLMDLEEASDPAQRASASLNKVFARNQVPTEVHDKFLDYTRSYIEKTNFYFFGAE